MKHIAEIVRRALIDGMSEFPAVCFNLIFSVFRKKQFREISVSIWKKRNVTLVSRRKPLIYYFERLSGPFWVELRVILASFGRCVSSG